MDTRKQLTNTQQETLDCIVNYISENEFPPSLDEIAAIFGKRKTTIRDRLIVLAKKGYIKRISGKARGIKILK